jgi:hypothetical protein
MERITLLLPEPPLLLCTWTSWDEEPCSYLDPLMRNLAPTWTTWDEELCSYLDPLLRVTLLLPGPPGSRNLASALTLGTSNITPTRTPWDKLPYSFLDPCDE